MAEKERAEQDAAEKAEKEAKRAEADKAKAEKEDAPKVEAVKAEGGKADGIDTTKFGVKIYEEGDGPLVTAGTKVKAHYTGTLLDGTKFDSSRDRGKPLEFVIGTGRVIKCWDDGFLQLKKGSKAIFNCPPDVAYGKRAMGPIPADATL